MHVLKSFPAHLAYYLATFAIGAAGWALALQEGHPRWDVITLIGAYLALSLISQQSFITASVRHMHGLLALQSALVLALLVRAPAMNFFLIWFYVLSVYAVVALPQVAAYRWIALFALSTVASLVITYGWVSGLLNAAIYLSGFAFFVAFAHLTRQANEARAESERLLRELQEAHHALQAYAAQVEKLAVAEERNRLAREMHDTIGHRLTVAAVQLEAAQRLLPEAPERTAGMIATVREQVRAALNELRHTVAALRQPLESDLPLERAIPRLVTDFEQATGLQVTLEWPRALPPLTPPQRLTLFRAIQEGLTNVHKHAQARRARVRLNVLPDALTLQIVDDGRGPQRGRSGFGLRGLQERAAQLGGQVAFGPHPDGGAQLTITLPLPPTNATNTTNATNAINESENEYAKG